MKRSTAKPTILHRTRQELTAAIGSSAKEGDYTTFINQPTIVYDDDCRCVVLVYLLLEEDSTALVAALRRIPVTWHKRTGGLLTRSAYFGYSPRNGVRHNYCTATALAAEYPEAHALLTAYAATAAREYAWYNPDGYATHQEQVEQVLPEWRLEGTGFTSGVVNRDCPISYHRDAGNFPGMWSAMLGFKRGMQGGYLAIPEYDLALEIADNSLTMFDGQGIVHGVTPLHRQSADAYRLTVVYYALRQMWQCLPINEELTYTRQKRTALERSRVKRL